MPVTVGAGGLAGVYANGNIPTHAPGSTSFKTLGTNKLCWQNGVKVDIGANLSVAGGSGLTRANIVGATKENPVDYNDFHVDDADGTEYGMGGSAAITYEGTTQQNAILKRFGLGNGHQGCVKLRWFDPVKSGGPSASPALFTARRVEVQSTPATVNLYDPKTGEGSVWRAEDVEEKLADGMITQEAWLAICAERAALEYAAWLIDPETEPERYAMLRAARDARLSSTDYLVAPDYPLDEGEKAQIVAYRQALRDLPAQDGAPWDGGGNLTPWPQIPLVSSANNQ